MILFIQGITHSEFIAENFSKNTILFAFICGVLSYIFFLIGNKIKPNNVITPSENIESISPGYYHIIMLIWIIAIWPIFSLYGSLEFESISRKVIYEASSSNYLASFRYWIYLAPAFTNVKWQRNLAILGGLVLALVLGSRAYIWAFSITLILPFFWGKKMNIVKLIFVSLAFIIIGTSLVSFIKTNRDENILFSENKVSVMQINPFKDDFVPHSEVVMLMEILDHVPGEVSFDYGFYYLNYSVWWIPRSVWPDRPDLRQFKKLELEHVIGTSHISGPSITGIGMDFLEGGLFGIALFGLFTGMFYEHLYRKALFSRVHVYRYAAFIAILVVSVLGSGIWATFHNWAPSILLPFLGYDLWKRLKFT